MSDEALPPPAPDADPASRTLTGTILAERYRITARLGTGAMGEVYLGEHLRMGRRDAIKVLRSGIARDPEAVARFTRGARNVARIRHPNVCQVYDFGETPDGLLFLAMEYVEGGSLGDLLRERDHLPLDDAVRWIEEAAAALHVAHDLGIIHRDLKPDNLMLSVDPDGVRHVKVVDFDIAVGPSEEGGAGVTRHGFVVGTPEYMSPEQLTGDPLDRRSDVYALALVFVKLVTGRLPFDGTSAQDIMLQRLTVEPTPISALAPPGVMIPPTLETAIARGLARRPRDRIPDARSLAEVIRDAVAAGRGAPTSVPMAPPKTPPPGPAPNPAETIFAPKPRRRIGTPVLAATGAFGLVVVGFVAWALLGGGWNDAPEIAEPGESSRSTVVMETVEDAPASADESIPVATEGETGSGATGSTQGQMPPAPAIDSEAASDPDPGVTAAPAGPMINIAVDQARTVLMRQFELQGEGSDSPPAVHRAVRDTTQAVWNLAGISMADSAFAAHMHGLALFALGDTTGGLQWLDEAVRVEPLDRYRLVRDRVRDALRGRP